MSTNLPVPQSGSKGESPSMDPRNPFQPGELIASRARSRIPTQTIILTMCLVCSAAALYAMRRYGMQSGMVFTEVNMDYNGPDTEKARTYQRIMADLARAQAPLDVALGDFGRSPFMLDMGQTKVSPDIGMPVATGATEEERREAEARMRAHQRDIELSQMAKSFRLQSVMGGSKPLARINDQTVTVGSMLDNDFKVVGIEGRSVTVEVEGKQFVLTMEQGKQDQGKRPPANIGTAKANGKK